LHTGLFFTFGGYNDKNIHLRPNLSRNNKKKIFNDPVYGFISIPNEIIFDIIQHPYFQRLRRIKQLGLTDLVYPGALHTRFHHALGAMHLMYTAIQVIRRKGHEITAEEEHAVLCAILLHDIGHGPFSHTLEYDIVNGVSHEEISSMFIHALGKSFSGKLDLSLAIFQNKYEKPFLHQLVSSQLDMDRLDYLNRDSFYTGVSEGIIGSERIIEMLNVHDGQLVLEEKGIYSVEKFIVARRLMYWQVYLHKTVVSAELMLIHLLRRAKKLVESGQDLFASPSLQFFLKNKIGLEDFKTNPIVLDHFANLDDFDILGAIKVWKESPDLILSDLSRRLVNRDLLKIEISKEPFSAERILQERKDLVEKWKISFEDSAYYVYSQKLTNSAYNHGKENINLKMKSGEIIDLSKASDNLNISALANPVEKYCLCYPT
jgi:HD superfamily phosphohydrolase|tara:strand:+ start:39090 stop:40382 length:1293 start_codon:yes stop_codon:yes gene_type:complete